MPMRYDSTYSALQALNKALGGEEKQPDSEYSAVINLMSTLNGGEVDAANAFEAVETIAEKAENNELPIQQGGGCKLASGLVFKENGDYYPSDYNADGFGWFRVDVEQTGDVPAGSTIVPPIEIQIISWSEEYTVREGPTWNDYDNNLWVRFRIKNLEGWSFTGLESSFGEDVWDYGTTWHFTDKSDEFIYELLPSPEMKYQRFITLLLNKLIIHNNQGIEVKKNLDHQFICLTRNYEETGWEPEFADSIPDGYLDWNTNYVEGWGNPDEAIPVTINEFINADGYDQNQWFEITATIQGCPQVEVGRIVIDDNTADIYYGDRKGLFINGVSYGKYDGTDGMWGEDFTYHMDGSQITIKTLRHSVEIDGETKICGGKAYGSPVAILTADTRGPASEW